MSYCEKEKGQISQEAKQKILACDLNYCYTVCPSGTVVGCVMLLSRHLSPALLLLLTATNVSVTPSIASTTATTDWAV